MALDFPNSPTNGQQYSAPNGVTYVYDGTVWTSGTASSGAPPIGAASGDLSGSYPGPTVAKLNGAALGTTTPLARGDLLVGNATPAFARLPLGAASTVLQSNGTDAVWGTSLGGPPSGAAGGDLQGTYPNPTINPTKLPWTPSGGTLTPTDATKTVSVPGGAAGVGAAHVLLGSNPSKARLQSANSAAVAWASLSANRDAVANTQDDVTKPSWQLLLNPNTGTDSCSVIRQPAGGAYVTLLTVDSIGNVLAPGDATKSTGLVLGAQTIKVRLQTPNATTPPWAALSVNRDPSSGVVDDSSKIAYQLLVNPGSDNVILYRAPAGGGVANIFMVNGASSPPGDLTITGNNATKASGTTWANPSDPRLKKDVAPYPRGLADVVQLEPITYRYNGRGGTALDLAGIGLDAAAVEPIFPECVGTQSVRLDADDAEPVDIKTLDVSPIIFALINAVRELATRLAALEAAAHA